MSNHFDKPQFSSIIQYYLNSNCDMDAQMNAAKQDLSSIDNLHTNFRSATLPGPLRKSLRVFITSFVPQIFISDGYNYMEAVFTKDAINEFRKNYSNVKFTYLFLKTLTVSKWSLMVEPVDSKQIFNSFVNFSIKIVVEQFKPNLSEQVAAKYVHGTSNIFRNENIQTLLKNYRHWFAQSLIEKQAFNASLDDKKAKVNHMPNLKDVFSKEPKQGEDSLIQSQVFRISKLDFLYASPNLKADLNQDLTQFAQLVHHKQRCQIQDLKFSDMQKLIIIEEGEQFYNKKWNKMLEQQEQVEDEDYRKQLGMKIEYFQIGTNNIENQVMQYDSKQQGKVEPSRDGQSRRITRSQKRIVGYNFGTNMDHVKGQLIRMLNIVTEKGADGRKVQKQEKRRALTDDHILSGNHDDAKSNLLGNQQSKAYHPEPLSQFVCHKAPQLNAEDDTESEHSLESAANKQLQKEKAAKSKQKQTLGPIEVFTNMLHPISISFYQQYLDWFQTAEVYKLKQNATEKQQGKESAKPLSSENTTKADSQVRTRRPRNPIDYKQQLEQSPKFNRQDFEEPEVQPKIVEEEPACNEDVEMTQSIQEDDEVAEQQSSPRISSTSEEINDQEMQEPINDAIEQPTEKEQTSEVQTVSFGEHSSPTNLKIDDEDLANSQEQLELQMALMQQQIKELKEKMELKRRQAEQKEKMRLEQERLERERIERQRLENERLERERLERERLEKLEQERLERERERQRLERERIEKERQEKERIEKERLERERLEREQIELERKQKEQDEKLRFQREKEKLEQIQLEIEKQEKERLKKEQERIDKERLEKEYNEKQKRLNQMSSPERKLQIEEKVRQDQIMRQKFLKQLQEKEAELDRKIRQTQIQLQIEAEKKKLKDAAEQAAASSVVEPDWLEGNSSQSQPVVQNAENNDYRPEDEQLFERQEQQREGFKQKNMCYEHQLNEEIRKNEIKDLKNRKVKNSDNDDKLHDLMKIKDIKSSPLTEQTQISSKQVARSSPLKPQPAPPIVEAPSKQVIELLSSTERDSDELQEISATEMKAKLRQPRQQALSQQPVGQAPHEPNPVSSMSQNDIYQFMMAEMKKEMQKEYGEIISQIQAEKDKMKEQIDMLSQQINSQNGIKQAPQKPMDDEDFVPNFGSQSCVVPTSTVENSVKLTNTVQPFKINNEIQPDAATAANRMSLKRSSEDPRKISDSEAKKQMEKTLALSSWADEERMKSHKKEIKQVHMERQLSRQASPQKQQHAKPDPNLFFAKTVSPKEQLGLKTLPVSKFEGSKSENMMGKRFTAMPGDKENTKRRRIEE